MKIEMGLIVTRPWNLDTDKAFVLSTWLRGAYYGDSWFSLIPKDRFMQAYEPFLQKLLDTPGVDVTVACLAEDPDVLIGYVVHTNTVVHWMFVKKSWRKIGVAKSLLPPRVSCVSHLTSLGKKLLPKLPGAVFDPFIV